jgi:hypothetical protein
MCSASQPSREAFWIARRRASIDGINHFFFEVDIDAAKIIIFADAVFEFALGVEEPEKTVSFAEFFELLIAGAIEK